MKHPSYLIAGIVMLTLSGCTQTHYKTKDDLAVEACIDLGGIPIMSMWNTNQMAACDFPTK